MTGPEVVAIGGGHGLAMTLRAVTQYAGRTTAVVATGDDGGSTGRIRRDLDMPAPGDLRRCLTTVARNRPLAAALEHRFTNGELAGHAVGNLVLAGLVDAGHDLPTAAGALARWLDLDAGCVQVLPVTSESVELVGSVGDVEARGQVAVEALGPAAALRFEPARPDVPGAVIDAIATADQVVLGPGSLVTSVLAAAAVPAVRDALEDTSAPVVLVANLRLEGTEEPAVDRQLTAFAAHGIRLDAVIANDEDGPGAGLEAGVRGAAADGGVTVIHAPVDRPHGLAHDADLLARVLADHARAHEAS